MRIDLFSFVELKIVDIGNGAGVIRKELPQHAFAVDQWHATEVIFVQVEQVEGLKGKPRRCAFPELSPQRLKVGQAGLAKHGDLAVDHHIMVRKPLGGSCDRHELLCPI